MAYMTTGDFATSGTNCVAKDPETLQLFRLIQLEINRFASSMGFIPLKDDGVLGSKTMDAYRKISPGTAASGKGCELIGQKAKEVYAFLFAKANTAKLPAAPPPKPVVAQPRVAGDPGAGLENTNLNVGILDQITGFVTSPMGMIAGAGAIGLILLATRKKRPASAAPAALVVAPKVP